MYASVTCTRAGRRAAGRESQRRSPQTAQARSRCRRRPWPGLHKRVRRVAVSHAFVETRRCASTHARARAQARTHARTHARARSRAHARTEHTHARTHTHTHVHLGRFGICSSWQRRRRTGGRWSSTCSPAPYPSHPYPSHPYPSHNHACQMPRSESRECHDRSPARMNEPISELISGS